MMNIFFIGDIVGAPGRRAVAALLHKVIDRYQIDLVVANGVNLAGGIGITPALADELLQQGIDVLTSGNHLWKYKEIIPYLQTSNRLLRPANYPSGSPGQGLTIVETPAGEAAAILNLEGRVFMSSLECPFRCADRVLATLPPEVQVILVDIHAEATSEKQALGWYLNGRVSAVVGTHTHVQTADERILPGGTGYLTDAGTTGPCDSVIGMKKEVIIERFLTQRPQPFKVATQNIQLQGVVSTIHPEGRCLNLTRIQLPLKHD